MQKYNTGMIRGQLSYTHLAQKWFFVNDVIQSCRIAVAVAVMPPQAHQSLDRKLQSFPACYNIIMDT